MKFTQAFHTKSGRVGALCLAAAVVVTAAIAIPFSRRAKGGAEQSAALLTPGLSVIAEENSMAMAGIRGESIRFEAADFARAVNRSRVSSVVVTSVPPVSDGELRVGSTVLTEGQTVSGSNLSLLTYTAKSDVSTSSFRFRVEDSAVEMTCMLYMLDRYNASPAVTLSTSGGQSVYTHENTVLHGTLSCDDPEGDATRIEIVSYPKSGSLLLSDPASGQYTYAPAEGVTGEDSFSYVARDLYGNYSAAATVKLEIVKSKTSVVYADLEDSPYANAALTMTDAGIMSGTQVGSSVYFRPDTEVSRAEFVGMAMKALGMTEVSYAETVFADNAQIPAELRGYVATAYELGYLRGIAGEDGLLTFEPNRALTKAEAAVMLGGMLELATPTVTPTFSDSSEIPAWAAPSVYSLHAAGIPISNGNSVEPLASVTRADAALLLSGVMATLR